MNRFAPTLFVVSILFFALGLSRILEPLPCFETTIVDSAFVVAPGDKDQPRVFHVPKCEMYERLMSRQKNPWVETYLPLLKKLESLDTLATFMSRKPLVMVVNTSNPWLFQLKGRTLQVGEQLVRETELLPAVVLHAWLWGESEKSLKRWVLARFLSDLVTGEKSYDKLSFENSLKNISEYCLDPSRDPFHRELCGKNNSLLVRHGSKHPPSTFNEILTPWSLDSWMISQMHRSYEQLSFADKSEFLFKMRSRLQETANVAWDEFQCDSFKSCGDWAYSSVRSLNRVVFPHGNEVVKAQSIDQVVWISGKKSEPLAGFVNRAWASESGLQLASGSWRPWRFFRGATIEKWITLVCPRKAEIDVDDLSSTMNQMLENKVHARNWIVVKSCEMDKNLQWTLSQGDVSENLTSQHTYEFVHFHGPSLEKVMKEERLTIPFLLRSSSLWPRFFGWNSPPSVQGRVFFPQGKIFAVKSLNWTSL